jgi:anti-sigma B factor antagonist
MLGGAAEYTSNRNHTDTAPSEPTGQRCPPETERRLRVAVTVRVVSSADDRMTITQMADGPVWVAGEVEVASCDTLREHLTAAAATAESELQVDLSQVEFMDSSGLRVLLETHEACESRDVKLVVLNPSPAVHRLLEITGLTLRL